MARAEQSQPGRVLMVMFVVNAERRNSEKTGARRAVSGWRGERVAAVAFSAVDVCIGAVLLVVEGAAVVLECGSICGLYSAKHVQAALLRYFEVCETMAFGGTEGSAHRPMARIRGPADQRPEVPTLLARRKDSLVATIMVKELRVATMMVRYCSSTEAVLVGTAILRAVLQVVLATVRRRSLRACDGRVRTYLRASLSPGRGVPGPSGHFALGGRGACAATDSRC